MKLKGKIVLHILFWILVEVILYRSCYPVGKLLVTGELLSGEIGWIVVIHFVHFITFYAFYFVFISEHSFTLKISVIYVIVFCILCLSRYYGLNALYEAFEYPFYFGHMRSLKNVFYLTFIFCVYATFIGLFESRVKFVKLKKELRDQNIQSEMALLRSQINPHFLYNTLNNIYSLAYPKSAKAAQAVMKLSYIMRYSLTEANSNFVSLQKEIDYLNSYISLEQMRYTGSSYIHFSNTGDSHNIMVAPMLFVPFIENAVKYGTLEGREIAVRIELHVEKDFLTFEVVNYYNQNSKKSEGSGIGIKNVKRRLELIYPKKHELLLEDNKKESRFRVRLTIRF